MIILSSSTYQGFLNTIKGYCDINGEIRTFLSEAGDQMGALSIGVEAYPIVFVEPRDMVLDNHINEMRFRIYVYDRLEKDRSNYGVIKDKTSKIIIDLSNFLRFDSGLPFEISSVSTAFSFEEILSTHISGWYIDVDVDMENTTLCDIPLKSDVDFKNSICSDAYNEGYLKGKSEGGKVYWTILEYMYGDTEENVNALVNGDDSTPVEYIRSSLCDLAYYEGYIAGIIEGGEGDGKIYWSKIEI